jgi:hypothetical protein
MSVMSTLSKLMVVVIWYDHIVRVRATKQLDKHILTITAVVPKGTSKASRYEPKSYSFNPVRSDVTLDEIERVVRNLNFSVFGISCKSFHLTI